MAKKSKKVKWVEIADSNVRHVWECPTCGTQATVSPTFYHEGGTPICTGNGKCEGDDMIYIRTEILGFQTRGEDMTCKRCGTTLKKNGRCKDITCPYSDRGQNAKFTEG
jgi:hypothetical protein